MKVGLTHFVTRQLGTAVNIDFDGTRLSGDQLGSLRAIAEDAMDSPYQSGLVTDGHAPYVKIIKIYQAHKSVLDTLQDIRCPIVAINEDNRHYLIAGYKSRRIGELPVLTRWFSPGVGLRGLEPHHINVVLYSREQLLAEGKESGIADASGADWDIVSINAELEKDAPMTPITLMRNALGKAHGGNGSEFDVEEYERSVEFWSEHAMICG